MSDNFVISTRSLHEQVSVSFDKREALCILMQYEIELMYTLGTIAVFILFCNIFFYQMVMMWKSGTVQNFHITANSL